MSRAGSEGPTRRRRLLPVLVRGSVTAVLLWILARSLDLGVLADHLAGASLGWLSVCLSILLAARFVVAWRWHILLRAYDVTVAYGALVRSVFLSMFVGQFLPGLLGTDVVRGVDIAGRYGRSGKVVLTLVIDRFAGALGLAVTALAGAALARGSGRPTGLLALTALMTAGLLVLALLPFVSLRWGWGSDPGAGSSRAGRWLARLRRLFETTRVVARRRGVLAGLVGLSFATAVLRCAEIYTLYRAFAVDVPVAETLVFVPFTFLAVLIPLSLGGLGVREASLAILYGRIGVAGEASVGVGLMYQLLQIVTSLPGAVPLLRGWRRSGAHRAGPTGGGRDEERRHEP